MVKMCTKFDEEAHNGLVSILITSLFQYMYMPTVTLTCDIKNQ